MRTRGMGGDLVDGRFVILTNCGGCGTGWGSRDGRDWRLPATLGEERPGSMSQATVAGRRRRRAMRGRCQVRILIADDGRTDWTPAPQICLGDPLVTYAAGTYIGTTVGDGDPEAPRSARRP